MSHLHSSTVESDTVAYFRCHKQGYWRRADQGEVYEWHTGITICFREYLQDVLSGLGDLGLPDLGPVLLVIGVARDHDASPWMSQQIFELQLDLCKDREIYPAGVKDVEKMVEGAVNLFNLIRQLPPEHRSAAKMPLLIRTLFGGQELAYPAERAGEIVKEYISGRSDAEIASAVAPWSLSVFYREMALLNRVWEEFPDKEKIITALRTGLTKVPDPADIKLPEPEKGDLLDELEKDDRSYGMARLARRLMAAIHIPLHTRGSSDQSYGGVSDITNRGNFDRLLLSELAYDDTTLLARLANNEALYLRREEPPQDLIEKRVVLLDATLKMWGIPRVFAISAGLACTVTEQQELAVGAYAMGGSDYDALDLQSKAGVIDALSILDPALDCGEGLRKWASEYRPSVREETIFITGAWQMRSPAFMAALAESRDRLDYLITVSREGQMQFFQFSGGRRKLLNQAQLNLDETLFAQGPKKILPRKGRDAQGLPAFYRMEAAPLLFPYPGGKLDKKRTFAPGDPHILSVLANGRVLYWNRHISRAAREVLPRIEEGEYCFGRSGLQTLCVMVGNRAGKLLKLYTYSPSTRQSQELDLSDQAENWYGFRFRDEHFIVDMPGQKPYTRDYMVVDPESMAIVTDRFTGAEISEMMYKGKTQEGTMDGHQLKIAINQGYSMVKKISQVGISPDGRLVAGRRILTHQNLRTESQVKWIDKSVPDKISALYAERDVDNELCDPDNKVLTFKRFVWPDGSELLADMRGFLHLSSSDHSIPSTTVAMVVGAPTAIWAEGLGCVGNPVFLVKSSDKSLDEMYERTVKAFIDVILKKCS